VVRPIQRRLPAHLSRRPLQPRQAADPNLRHALRPALDQVSSDAGAEGERFFWGKALFEWQTYKNHARTGVGRGQQLLESQRRQLWDAFWAEGKDSFTHRRIATLKAVRDRATLANQRFTHVLVDECQDFTEADYELLRYVIDDPSDWSWRAMRRNHCTWVGRIGARLSSAPTGLRRSGRLHRLEGSYRLPVAACRAVAPLATYVAQLVSGSGGSADDLTIPSLGRPPVSGRGRSSCMSRRFRRELPRILHLYKQVSRTESVCITDGSKGLRDAVSAAAAHAGFTVDMENMRKIKGLERKMVIVLAQASNHHDNETAAQCFYTR
jgi:hypothetical protein